MIERPDLTRESLLSTPSPLEFPASALKIPPWRGVFFEGGGMRAVSVPRKAWAIG